VSSNGSTERRRWSTPMDAPPVSTAREAVRLKPYRSRSLRCVQGPSGIIRSIKDGLISYRRSDGSLKQGLMMSPPFSSAMILPISAVRVSSSCAFKITSGVILLSNAFSLTLLNRDRILVLSSAQFFFRYPAHSLRPYLHDSCSQCPLQLYSSSSHTYDTP
jgi:hypothetical protein